VWHLPDHFAEEGGVEALMAAPTVFAIEFVSLFFACVLFVWFYTMTASSVLLVEPIGDAVLIEHLEGARLQTAGARAVELLAGAPLDDRSVDPRQRQRARQHQPARTSAGDRHGTFGHGRTPITSRSHPSTSALIASNRAGSDPVVYDNTRISPLAS